MTATATLDDQQLVSKPDPGVIFLSRRSDLRLVKTPRYPIYGPAGNKTGEHQGETVAFRDGRFYCPAGGDVELEDGRKVPAAGILEFLQGHRLLGHIEEGFWPVSLTAPPISPDEMFAVADAASKWDYETLERLLAQERDGWNRQDLIDRVQGLLRDIRAREEKMRAELEAEREKESKPKQAKPKE